MWKNHTSLWRDLWDELKNGTVLFHSNNNKTLHLDTLQKGTELKYYLSLCHLLDIQQRSKLPFHHNRGHFP